jgi:hypothetical protein
VQPTATHFDDQLTPWTYSVPNNFEPTFDVASTSDTVQSIFNRQILIRNYQWAIGQTLFEKFNPWRDYFENPRVINRIANFRLLRCRLHLKFVINGNGFYYGRCMASYVPLHRLDRTTRFRLGNQRDFIAASQRPHIYLDPTNSQGGDMELPFFYPKNAMEIPLAEWDNMGEITLADLTPLLITTDNTDPITISVFAYATDIHISQPTSTQPTLQNQMDEYTGVLSKPASVIGNIASKLKVIPSIAPYMRATEMVANTAASLASFFGYSKPRELEMCNMAVSAFYEGNVYNTKSRATTLALDSKKEVTIDPRTVGLSPNDEMSFVELAKRESYLTSFEWTTGDSVNDLIFNSHVMPTLSGVDGSGEVHLTPSAWVSVPFKWWHGSMEFRFQIVASKYHKGRLRIVWDPNYQANSEYNLNYQEVIDINSISDFVFKVGWGQPVSYLPVISPTTEDFGNVAIQQRIGNGVLSVFVVTDLTVPTAVDAPVIINVFTRMCDDFEVAEPTGIGLTKYDLLPPLPDQVQSPLLTYPGVFLRMITTPFREEVQPVATGIGSLGSGSVAGLREVSFNLPYWKDPGTTIDTVTIRMRTTNVNNTTLTVFLNGASVLLNVLGGTTNLLGANILMDVSTLSDGPNSLFGQFTFPDWNLAGGSTFEVLDFTARVPQGVTLRYLPFLDSTAGFNVVGTQTIYAGEDVSRIGPGGLATYVAPDNKVIRGEFGIVHALVPENDAQLELQPQSLIASTSSTQGVPTPWIIRTVIGSTPILDWIGVTNVSIGYVWCLVSDPVLVNQSEIYLHNQMDESTTTVPTSAPIGDSPQTTMGPTITEAHNCVFFGEAVSSWRVLLKRYVRWLQFPGDDFTYDFPIYPSYLENLGLFNEYLTPMEWVMPAYVASRGGTRFCFLPPNGELSQVVVARGDGEFPGFDFQGSSVSMSDTFGGPAASAYVNIASFNELVVENPWYSPYRFYPNRQRIVKDDSEKMLHTNWTKVSTPNSLPVYLMVGAAEDFSCFFFLSAPIVQLNT